MLLGDAAASLGPIAAAPAEGAGCCSHPRTAAAGPTLAAAHQRALDCALTQ